MNLDKILNNAINDSIRVKAMLKDCCSQNIKRLILAAIRTLKSGKAIYLFGNGGSAADAQHIAAELQGKFYKKRRPVSAIALTTNTSSLTAIGNDFGYEYTFERQVKAHVKKGDMVLAISTSGNSENVIKAIKSARKLGAATAGLIGSSGGKLKKIVDISICVPSTNVARTQECHALIGHIMCEAIEKNFC